MNKKGVIKKTVGFVKKEFKDKSCGHDWWHIYRVWKLAHNIANSEKNVDRFVIDMAALLHDVGDPKFYKGDVRVAPRMIGSWLDKMKIKENDKKHIMHIIANMSFSKSLDKKKVKKSKEFMIIQDADRLDAIGAIGVGRTFAYGGSKGKIMYDPDIKPKLGRKSHEYRKDMDPTINHFYEKLLLLKDMMNTKTGKKIALRRQRFMQLFLKEFYKEWDAKD